MKIEQSRHFGRFGCDNLSLVFVLEPIWPMVL